MPKATKEVEGQFDILNFSSACIVQITSEPVGFKINSSVGMNKVSTLIIQDYTAICCLSDRI